MEEKEQKKSGETKEKGLTPRELKQKLEECEKLKTEYLTGWQRARAELLNYKREEMERIGEILKYANVGLISKILSILDNFELSEKELPENLREDENVKGILQIKTQILDFLKNQGVEEIKTIGEAFDPNLHEAVEEIEPSFALASAEATAGKKVTENKEIKSGVIIEEIQKGYKINGRLLRPAKVKINK